MNDSQEHADVPMRPQTPPAVPPVVPPAPAPQAAPPPPAVSYALPAAAAGRVPGLQHKSPFIACVLSLMPGVGQIYVDAGRRAIYYNLALDGVEGIELPSMNLGVPGFGGSFAGGLAMIGIGVILLANTRFGVSLAWIEEWWPAAPILLGTYLLVKAIQERKDVTPAAVVGGPSTDRLDTDSSSPV